MKKIIYPVLIIGFVLASLAPTFYELSQMGDLKPERSFELVHNFPTDYNFYLSRIKQGFEGRLTVVEKYTSEPHAGSLLHEFYLLLGRVGRWVRVPQGRASDVYHVARVVLGVTLLVLIAEFCRKSFSGDSEYSDGQRVSRSGRQRVRTSDYLSFQSSEFSEYSGMWALLAFLLAVTASSWPKLVAVVNHQVVAATLDNIASWRFGGYMSWWSVMDSLQRITFIPHLLAGQALMVFFITALTDFEVIKKGGNWIFLGILAFILGMVFPPGLVFLYGVMGLFLLLRWRTGEILPYFVVSLLAFPALLYLSLMTSFYPWKRLAEFDVLHPLPFEYLEYFQAVGPLLPLGLMGLVVALKRKERAILPSVAWVGAWLLLLVVFRFVPEQSALRFSEMIPQVPLGVLTAYLFYKTYNCYKNYKRYISVIIPAAIIVVGLGVMYSSYLWQKDFVDHKIRATLPLVPTGSYVMYPLKDFIAAMGFLWDATKGKGVILSETTAGNYIPAVSGNFVYVGHDNTVAFEEKREQVKAFFAGRMEVAAAKIWVKETRASYVFFGPQEREDGGIKDLRSVYPFLTEVYKNGYVTLYRVE